MFHRSNGKDAVFDTPEWASKLEAMKTELRYFEKYVKVSTYSGLIPTLACKCLSHRLKSVLAGEELPGRRQLHPR